MHELLELGKTFKHTIKSLSQPGSWCCETEVRGGGCGVVGGVGDSQSDCGGGRKPEPQHSVSEVAYKSC